MSHLTPPSPSLLFGSLAATPRPVPVFAGDQREKALQMLSSAVSEQRLITVLQIVRKDPSLVFEKLHLQAGPGLSQAGGIEFPLACLTQELAAGYVYAISQGFDVNEPLRNGRTTLLHEALLKTPAASLHDVGLLLSMGARPHSSNSAEALYAALCTSFPHEKVDHAPGLLSMLLDAKVSLEYDDTYLCPYSILTRTGGWNDPKSELILTKLIVRLAKSGLNLDRQSGSPKMTPLWRAIGSKAGNAAVALVRVGAQSGPEHLGGRDLFALLNANKLEAFIPQMQAAVMESHISRRTREQQAEPAVKQALESSASAAQVDRRKMRVL